MSKAVGIRIDGGIEWHAAGVVMDYATLCGLDADDPSLGHLGTEKPRRGQKITCGTCRLTWNRTLALRLRSTDFEGGAQDD